MTWFSRERNGIHPLPHEGHTATLRAPAPGASDRIAATQRAAEEERRCANQVCETNLDGERRAIERSANLAGARTAAAATVRESPLDLAGAGSAPTQIHTESNAAIPPAIDNVALWLTGDGYRDTLLRNVLPTARGECVRRRRAGRNVPGARCGNSCNLGINSGVLGVAHQAPTQGYVFAWIDVRLRRGER